MFAPVPGRASNTPGAGWRLRGFRGEALPSPAWKTLATGSFVAGAQGFKSPPARPVGHCAETTPFLNVIECGVIRAQPLQSRLAPFQSRATIRFAAGPTESERATGQGGRGRSCALRALTSSLRPRAQSSSTAAAFSRVFVVAEEVVDRI